MTDAIRILLIDDDTLNCKLLADALQASSFEVRCAHDGMSGLAALAEQPTDLVLLDVVMPHMSGHEVCRRIRAEARFAVLPVVLITALDAREDKIEGLAAGADDFLSKPLYLPEVLARVRSLLRIKRLYDTVEAQKRELAEWAHTLEVRVDKAVGDIEALSRLKRFFTPSLARRILAGAADDPLRSHRRDIAVVFLDLRGFTAFSETAEPETVMQALHDYHAAVGRIALAYDATIERFTGDGLMLFLNDPEPVERAARVAVLMACAMRQQIEPVIDGWHRHGHALSLAIGIARGYATLGAIGFEGRIDYGAVGSVTNLAARLCSHAQGNQIVVSQRVYAEIENEIAAEDLGEITLHGFARPVRAYAILPEP